VDVVETDVDAQSLPRPPLLVLERVRAFLDANELGSGTVRARRIGEGGGSNFTFVIDREDGSRYVLRRPPRPPLPPSAHDMVREARLQLAFRGSGFTRLPTIVAVC
jgi:aminoglycoside phosphotransferase (APT) family kinase protein